MAVELKQIDKYAVAMVYKIKGSPFIGLQIVKASSKEEALGISYRQRAETEPYFVLLENIVTKIDNDEDSVDQVQPTPSLTKSA